jgi:hypothetical protein
LLICVVKNSSVRLTAFGVGAKIGAGASSGPGERMIALLSVSCFIIGGFPFQDSIDVSFSVKDPNHSERILLNQIVDADVIKLLDMPGAQTGERIIGEMLGCAHARHTQNLFDCLLNRFQK